MNLVFTAMGETDLGKPALATPLYLKLISTTGHGWRRGQPRKPCLYHLPLLSWLLLIRRGGRSSLPWLDRWWQPEFPSWEIGKWDRDRMVGPETEKSCQFWRQWVPQLAEAGSRFSHRGIEWLWVGRESPSAGRGRRRDPSVLGKKEGLWDTRPVTSVSYSGGRQHYEAEQGLWNQTAWGSSSSPTSDTYPPDTGWITIQVTLCLSFLIRNMEIITEPTSQGCCEKSNGLTQMVNAAKY